MHYACAERLPILRVELGMDVVASCSVELGRDPHLGTRHSPTTKLGYRVRDLPIHHFMIIRTVVIPTSNFQSAQHFPSTIYDIQHSSSTLPIPHFTTISTVAIPTSGFETATLPIHHFTTTSQLPDPTSTYRWVSCSILSCLGRYLSSV